MVAILWKSIFTEVYFVCMIVGCGYFVALWILGGTIFESWPACGMKLSQKAALRYLVGQVGQAFQVFTPFGLGQLQVVEQVGVADWPVEGRQGLVSLLQKVCS